MANGRFLMKKLSKSKWYAALKSNDSRLAFTMILPHLDIEGRIIGESGWLKWEVFPLLKDFTEKKITACIDDIASTINPDTGQIAVTKYTIDGTIYVQYNNFKSEQPNLRADRESPSELPAPAGATPGLTPAIPQDIPLPSSLPSSLPVQQHANAASSSRSLCSLYRQLKVDAVNKSGAVVNVGYPTSKDHATEDSLKARPDYDEDIARACMKFNMQQSLVSDKYFLPHSLSYFEPAIIEALESGKMPGHKRGGKDEKLVIL